MKRSPKLTKRERQSAQAEESRQRLMLVVNRCRAAIADGTESPNHTSFERAARRLLSVYQDAPADEVTDAAIAMIEMAQGKSEFSVEEAIDSLAGICADEVRREAVRAELDATTARRLRLLFSRTPTSETIMARSAAFDQRLAEMAREIQ
jgi:hypothetical protein